MIKINDNYLRLTPSYLFTEIATRVADFCKSYPSADVIRMGIGDVTRPICEAAAEAMIRAVENQCEASTFHGYGPEQGYDFLRQAIADVDYVARGIDISPDEIFVSDGAKSDLGNIGDILDRNVSVAVTDPVYPVYVDTNVMAGRGETLSPDGRWNGLTYLTADETNGFCPELPHRHVDVVYLCYPNNPTGTVLSRDQLAMWVEWALREDALILFDSAYEAYVRTPGVPRSIYEIDGARKVAVEFRSFSKTAGFTGIRCGYTVVPNELIGSDGNGHTVSLNSLWRRRQTTKFNGAGYISQCGAAALYSEQGQRQVKEMTDGYMANAAVMRQALTSVGLTVYGGVDSPYLWVKAPGAMTSWEFFDWLLSTCHVVGTPGVGFGPAGEGFLRLTAFNTPELTQCAMTRIKEKIKLTV
ncbi:MAG: LL-diaminopimelate aminotransferase [Muribaculum sp.]|nr:LL-diaminopimelate aminotransferase [Muribaculum sp.]